MTPQLKRNGQIIASGGSFTLGTELTGQGSFNTMNLQETDNSSDMLVAGQTGALGISLHGISASQLNSLKARLQSTQQILQNQDETQLQTLTGEQLSGDLLTAVVWSYLASVESFGRIAQTQANMVDNPGLSYGFFHAMAVPIKSRGIAMNVQFPGVLMDIGHGRRMVWSKDNDPQAWIPYNKLRGTHASAMEHAIPEAFFNDPNATETQRTEGVSAVKALAIAAQQGQKIYTLTQANQDQIQNLQHSPRVIDNIRNALNSGLEVTIHERALSHAGFNGAGYIITDPQTGAGAYLIEGGGRGGYFLVLYTVIMAFLIISASLSGNIFAAAYLFYNFYTTIQDIRLALARNDFNGADQLMGLSLLSAFTGVLGRHLKSDGLGYRSPNADVRLYLFSASALMFSVKIFIGCQYGGESILCDFMGY